MLAIDTNVIVRYLTADHPVQSAKARALIDGADIFVCTTVLLETEWVLRSAYGLTPVEVAGALGAFAGLRPACALQKPSEALMARGNSAAARGCVGDQNYEAKHGAK